IEKRMKKVDKDVVNGVKGAKEEKEGLVKIMAQLDVGKLARSAVLTEAEQKAVKPLCLLTMKPTIYAANVAEGDLSTGNKFVEAVREYVKETGDTDEVAVVSAQVEAELKDMDREDRDEYLASLDVKESGCETLVKSCFKLLGLRTYFTCGPEESRAWTIKVGWKAPQAAGVIHNDFEKGFIKAATVSFDNMIACGSEEGAKEKGLLRIEGKDYVFVIDAR
ncbi:unnamed protein product, partial [Polarella glacialis]